MTGCSVMLLIFTITKKVDPHPLHLHVVKTGPPSSTDGDRTLFFGARAHRVWEKGGGEGEAGKSEGKGRWRSTAVQIN